MEKYTPFIIAILHHLPYLKPVIISTQYQEMNKESIGLQYIPVNHTKNLNVEEVYLDESTN
ncbi:hypothetical protein CQJ30_17280 [Caldibacillus thermoamylovorans]|nr:hypothetical protein [Caldibacillus thermoamylovorans]AWI13750.1 hypothetical protein CQJ30_17280 [Caldibacillus thermoamylovorans]